MRKYNDATALITCRPATWLKAVWLGILLAGAAWLSAGSCQHAKTYSPWIPSWYYFNYCNGDEGDCARYVWGSMDVCDGPDPDHDCRLKQPLMMIFTTKQRQVSGCEDGACVAPWTNDGPPTVDSFYRLETVAGCGS